MRRRIWVISAVVVVLAAAGTATALLAASGNSGSDYKALPTCERLAPLLPGQPRLKTEKLTKQPLERGVDPAFMSLICTQFDSEDNLTMLSVDIYQAGIMDLSTAMPYADKAVHDSRWRAKTEFDRRSSWLDQLSPDVRYSSRLSGDAACEANVLKRNATVILAIPLTGDAAASPEKFKAACLQIAENVLPKLVDAALS